MAEGFVQDKTGIPLDNELKMSEKKTSNENLDKSQDKIVKKAEGLNVKDAAALKSAKESQKKDEEASVSVEDSAKEKLKQELRETKDRFIRLAADFDNFKKLAQRDQLNSVKYANEKLIIDLLPVLDNLEQAISSGKKSKPDAFNDGILLGVEMVCKQLFDVLKKFGAECFSAHGKQFDPSLHEAMGQQEAQDVEPDTVVAEYQKGYLLNGRLLRPARVIVAKRPGN